MRLFVSWITDYNRFPTHCQGFISVWEGCKSQTIFFTCKTRGSSEKGEKKIKKERIRKQQIFHSNLSLSAWLQCILFYFLVMFKRVEIHRWSFLWGGGAEMHAVPPPPPSPPSHLLQPLK